MFGLLGHLGLEPAVQVLETHGHVVEAVGHLAELVVCLDVDTRAQVAAGYGLQPALQAGQWLEDEQMRGIQQRHASCKGQRQQRELQRAEDGGPALQARFDAGDQVVDLGHKVTRQLARLLRPGAVGNGTSQGLPAGARGLKGRSGGVVSGYEQRTRGVTGLQQREAGVVLRGQRWQLRQVLRRRHLGIAPGLHAQSAGFVDGGGTALQLPGHPDGEGNGAQGHHHDERAQGAQLRGQRGTLQAMARTLKVGVHVPAPGRAQGREGESPGVGRAAGTTTARRRAAISRPMVATSSTGTPCAALGKATDSSSAMWAS